MGASAFCLRLLPGAIACLRGGAGVGHRQDHAAPPPRRRISPENDSGGVLSCGGAGGQVCAEIFLEDLKQMHRVPGS